MYVYRKIEESLMQKEFKGFIHDKTVDQVITLNSYD